MALPGEGRKLGRASSERRPAEHHSQGEPAESVNEQLRKIRNWIRKAETKFTYHKKRKFIKCKMRQG